MTIKDVLDILAALSTLSLAVGVILIHSHNKHMQKVGQELEKIGSALKGAAPEVAQVAKTIEQVVPSAPMPPKQ